MNREEIPLSARAAELKQSFDQTFAAAITGTGAPTKAFLAIGIGGDSYALSLAEVSGLFIDKKVVPLPSNVPDLLGIASFRGALVPVYDLRVLLGYSAAGPSPRWMVLVAPDSAVGLAFDHLDGYLDLPQEAIAHPTGSEPVRQHLAETVRAGGTIRPVVGVASIMATIKQRAQPTLTHRGS